MPCSKAPVSIALSGLDALQLLADGVRNRKIRDAFNCLAVFDQDQLGQLVLKEAVSDDGVVEGEYRAV